MSVSCKHWSDCAIKSGGCCALGLYGGKPSAGICTRICKQREAGLGDVVAIIATPIARALKLKCIDPATQELRPKSKCAKRRARLNALRVR